MRGQARSRHGLADEAPTEGQGRTAEIQAEYKRNTADHHAAITVSPRGPPAPSKGTVAGIAGGGKQGLKAFLAELSAARAPRVVVSNWLTALSNLLSPVQHFSQL